MKQIIHDRLDLTKLLNIRVISLDEAPRAYKEFNDGAAVKFVIDPHGMIGGAATSTVQSSRAVDPEQKVDEPIKPTNVAAETQ